MGKSRKAYRKKTKNRKRRRNLKGGAPETDGQSITNSRVEDEKSTDGNEELIAQRMAENVVKKKKLKEVNKEVNKSDKVLDRIKNERQSITQNVNVKDSKFEEDAVQLRYYEDEFDKKLAELNAIKELLEQARKEYNNSKRNYQYSQIDKFKYP